MRALLTQPIEMRVNEMIAGIRGDVGLKIYGDDLEAMKSKAKEVEAVLKQIPGAADVSTEQVTGQPVLEARVIDESLSRYGVDRSDVLAFVEAAAGIRVGEIREGPRRFPLVLKLAGAYQGGVEELASVVVPTATGQRIPLTSLVTLESTTGPFNDCARSGPKTNPGPVQCPRAGRRQLRPGGAGEN
jgi:cobalt-zinc-cadmium resistance protein CzcA